MRKFYNVNYHKKGLLPFSLGERTYNITVEASSESEARRMAKDRLGDVVIVSCSRVR